MFTKILITTSHRPTPTIRRFAKSLTLALPQARYVTRGKLTFAMLALQAFDLGAERVLVIRGRKGNPGYIDVYRVNYLDKSLDKLCSMCICGYIINRVERKAKHYMSKHIVMTDKIVDNICEDLAECLLVGFNIVTLRLTSPFQYDPKEAIIVNVRKTVRKDRIQEPLYEISFKYCNGDTVGPVIRVCKTRTFIKPQ